MVRARRPLAVIQSPHPDCVRGEPCPWVSCRFHLWRERAEDAKNDPDGIADMIASADETCALDVAREHGPLDARSVGELLGVSNMLVLRAEWSARARLGLKYNRDDFEDHPDDPYRWFQDATNEDLAEVAAELRRRAKGAGQRDEQRKWLHAHRSQNCATCERDGVAACKAARGAKKAGC
jgi:hypothetical protein